MKPYIICVSILLHFLNAKAQVPVDSMPVSKPQMVDSSILVKPERNVENMPVVKPNDLPPQQNSPVDKQSESRTTPKKETIRSKRK